jgi:hypothetical protein
LDTSEVTNFFSGPQYNTLVAARYRMVEIGADHISHRIYLGVNGKIDSILQILEHEDRIEKRITQQFYYKPNGQLVKIIHNQYKNTGELYKIQLDTIVYDNTGAVTQFCSDYIKVKTQEQFRPTSCIRVVSRDSLSTVIMLSDSNCTETYDNSGRWKSRQCIDGHYSFCEESMEGDLQYLRYFDSISGEPRLLIMEVVSRHNLMIEKSKNTSDLKYKELFQYDERGNLTEFLIGDRPVFKVFYTDLNLPDKLTVMSELGKPEMVVEYRYYK